MSCMLPHKLKILSSEDANDASTKNNSKKLNTNISYHHYNQDEINNEFDDNEKSIDSNDDKAFDDVVFDVLKVEPEEIANQLTLIDLPLFKKIQPEELISCKWMSKEKHVKAPNIVAFTKRFNQTAFWVQKEILVCKRLERRAKMVTHFIKIAKRLNALQNFNSVMAIISGLKSAPIERLKKTWNLVSKRDINQFERIWHIMFDTSDNKRKLRDLHNHCKLPVIPFLGLYLTDLIHIDIAHPHNCFDNPQRRNQMNNICRILSDYQQSSYERLMEISYVKNYLNSFVYFEEFQKFKEDENYRDSLELEPEMSETGGGVNLSPLLTNDRFISSTPINQKYIHMEIDEKTTTTSSDLLKHGQCSSSSHSSSTTSTNSVTTIQNTTTKPSSNRTNNTAQNNNNLPAPTGKHRKTLSLAMAFTKDGNEASSKNSHSFANCDQTVKHPLDDSIIEDPAAGDSYMSTSLIKDLLKNRNKNLLLNDPAAAVDCVDSKCGGGRNLSNDFKTSLFDNDDNPTTGDDASSLGTSNSNSNRNNNNTITYDTSHHSNNPNSQNDKIRRTYEEKLLQTLSNEQKCFIIDYQTASALCFFESPVKRKCIMKNSQKPHFSQWHSYWLQLVGNVLIYSSSKINILPTSSSASSATTPAISANVHTHTTVVNMLGSTIQQASSCSSVNSDSAVVVSNNEHYYQSLLLNERRHYHKDPCKMHPIANWMVVALFQDDCSLLSATNATNNSGNSSNCSNNSRNSSSHSASTSSTSSKPTTCINLTRKKYDIQLNDLNNGTMYKYRFNNYKLAKEWYAYFKLAINLHERLKPENLIKFD